MRCLVHRDRVAAGSCWVCGGFYCEDCLAPAPGLHDPVCPTCGRAIALAAVAGPRGRRARTLLALALLLLAVGASALASYAVFRGRDRPAVPDESRSALLAAWEAIEETGLALEAYRQREGSYPQRLEDLLAHDLERVPLDPFSPDGDPLRFAGSGSPGGHVRLWSLGPDRLDQGAADWDPISGTGDIVYPVR